MKRSAGRQRVRDGRAASGAIGAMVEALSIEVEEVRKKGGEAKVRLENGELVREEGGVWIYRFPAPEDQRLTDELEVKVTVGGEEVTGTILSVNDREVLIALVKDMGPRIEEALLTADLTFLLTRLIERLEEVDEVEIAFNLEAAERTLGLGPARARDGDPARKVLEDRGLNADQEAAVRRSLGSDTAFIWGPPGTGKTTALARVVEAHYREGRTVLLVSNTNVAVDTALEKVAERLEGEPGFDDGLVIRYGRAVKEELRRRYGPQVILDEVVARKSGRLNVELEELKGEERKLSAERRSLCKARKLAEELRGLREDADKAEGAIATLQRKVETLEGRARAKREKAESLRGELERALRMGRLRRWLSGVDPKRLEEEAARLEAEAESDVREAVARAEERMRLEEEFEELRGRLRALEEEAADLPSPEDLDARLEAIAERLRAIRARRAAIEERLSKLRKDVLEGARVLATTVYHPYLSRDVMRGFDTVVVDEASMVMPPLVFFAAGLSKENVTIAGDFRQLPPIVLSDAPPCRKWLKCDVFEKSEIPERLGRREPLEELVPLGIQYRMEAPICELVSDLFYPERPLKTAKPPGRAAPPCPFGRSPLLYADTSPLRPWSAKPPGSLSRYNLLHALIVRNVAARLAEAGILPPDGAANDGVGAVSPYRAQATLIQALLRDRLGRRAAGVAATVHRFQGNEKRVMVLDLTDARGPKVGRFLKGAALQDDGARLLNVALSRARDHVILVADFEYLRSRLRSGYFTREILERFEEEGEPLDAKELLAAESGEALDAVGRALPGDFDLPGEGTAFFDERTFRAALARDFRSAETSVVIFSPSVSGDALEPFAEPLKAAAARGVSVRVVTQPPQASSARGGGPERALEELGALGVEVDFKGKMHEKLALIDGNVLWVGSLDILGLPSKGGVWVRVTSRAACEAFLRLFSGWSCPRSGEEESERARGAKPARGLPPWPACEECGGRTVLREGRYGVWFACARPGCGGKGVVRDRPKKKRAGRKGTSGGTELSQGPRHSHMRAVEAGAASKGPCPEPGCGGRLVARSGRYGPFWGCTNYPRCRHTEDMSGA